MAHFNTGYWNVAKTRGIGIDLTIVQILLAKSQGSLTSLVMCGMGVESLHATVTPVACGGRDGRGSCFGVRGRV